VDDVLPCPDSASSDDPGTEPRWAIRHPFAGRRTAKKLSVLGARMCPVGVELETSRAVGEHVLHWRRRTTGAIEWIAPAPGQLGGGTVTVSPPSAHFGRCGSCGRRARVRVAFLVLPVCSPFGP